jgi:hypothetical protein
MHPIAMRTLHVPGHFVSGSGLTVGVYPLRHQKVRTKPLNAATKGRISWLTRTKCISGAAFFDADTNQFLTD